MEQNGAFARRTLHLGFGYTFALEQLPMARRLDRFRLPLQPFGGLGVRCNDNGADGVAAVEPARTDVTLESTVDINIDSSAYVPTTDMVYVRESSRSVRPFSHCWRPRHFPPYLFQQHACDAPPIHRVCPMSRPRRERGEALGRSDRWCVWCLVFFFPTSIFPRSWSGSPRMGCTAMVDRLKSRNPPANGKEQPPCPWNQVSMTSCSVPIPINLD